MPCIKVFPTQVGMFPRRTPRSNPSTRFPHAGGDVSGSDRVKHPFAEFSPRRWGCFPKVQADPTGYLVFPTQVGMFLKVKEEIVASNCCAIARVLYDIAQVFTTN